MPRRFAFPLLVALLLMTTRARGAAHADPAGDLATLCEDYWQGVLASSPVTATSMGLKGYDDRLGDNSAEGIQRDVKRLEAVLARARAIDPKALGARDQVNRAALIETVESELAEIDCHFEEWVVDPLRGPHVWLFNLPDITTITSAEDGMNYVKRCEAFGTWVDRDIENLSRGLKAGRVASHDAIRKALEQLDVTLGQASADWAVMKPAQQAWPDWTGQARKRMNSELARTVDQTVRPALARYRVFLRDRLLPAARPQDKAGLASLPGGVDCYRKMIRVQTSLSLSPEAIHQIGLEQVARFRADLSALGARALGTGEVAEIQRKLRTDPAMHFATADQVEAKAREALARANEAMPKWFGIQPKAPCEVKVMGMHEAPNSTIAYYRRPAVDGSRPGYYMINTYKPETRPRYEAEALAFHEAVPGHHLQIAIMQELEDLPTFRKQQGVTAFVEGWALYTERLADEMGLYSSDLDRIGMLSYDAWRACRLVVDTGLHAMGWSRQQAIDYMIENSVLAENNITNEVDRYITWPGQALAYKLGQLEILKLRDEARAKLGDRFDIAAFHDAVLKNGAVTLPVLREQVEAWMATAQ